MSNAPKTVLCIHDLPGFGRAGLSVIVPVLSALGAQAVAVPTAVLSTHTGGLGTPAKLANPGYGPAAWSITAALACGLTAFIPATWPMPARPSW